MPDPAQPMTMTIAELVRTIHPEALLRLDVVRQITGLSSSAIYRRMAKGTFPRPKALGRSRRRLAGGQSAGMDQQPAGC